MRHILLLVMLMPLSVFAQNPPADMGQVFIEQRDVDKDGKVTLDEFRQPADNKFKMMDRNNDGAVTADEARNFARMMLQRMQQMQRMMQQQRQMPR
jgi:hypothetical protein